MDRATLRLGVLTPHAAIGPEAELPAMAAGRVTPVVARIRPPDPTWTPPTTATGLRGLTYGPALDRAVAALADGPVDAVVHASTSTAYALGPRAESDLVGRLATRCGAPVVGSGSSAVQALRASGSRRVALVHPPWFADEIDELAVRYFRDQGFEASVAKATGLPDQPDRVRPEQVVDWVVRHLDDAADAVFLSGNGFRTAAAVEDLERRTGRLVLAANQVLLWSALAATGTAWDVAGYGKLFRTTAPSAD